MTLARAPACAAAPRVTRVVMLLLVMAGIADSDILLEQCRQEEECETIECEWMRKVVGWKSKLSQHPPVFDIQHDFYLM